MNTEIFVFADWEELEKPALVGMLRSSTARNKEHFSFSYAVDWLQSPYARQIDPELALYSGQQHSEKDKNFRVFLDSCPDRWGRMLMKRREAIHAREAMRRPRGLNEIDYLLGVHDLHRAGALRFKRELDGPFLDDDKRLAAPPLSSLRELEHAARQVEGKADNDDPDYPGWMDMLMLPGSSLGGARPKASVTDENGHLWIAKFPSRHDDYDVAAWEYVAYMLALDAGVDMSESRIEKFGSHHHTFLTKRFDRVGHNRLHFTSAMAQLGYDDGDYEASYLELGQFLTDIGANTQEDLEQLWRRIVFYIAISNSDDHLRNHGFIHSRRGWLLSPAYDINPVKTATQLHLNINDKDNSLDYELAMEVVDFFQLNSTQARKIKGEVLASVGNWRAKANAVGLGRSEQKLMEPAFNL